MFIDRATQRQLVRGYHTGQQVIIDHIKDDWPQIKCFENIIAVLNPDLELDAFTEAIRKTLGELSKASDVKESGAVFVPFQSTTVLEKWDEEDA
jgi:hypothetical protein